MLVRSNFVCFLNFLIFVTILQIIKVDPQTQQSMNQTQAVRSALNLFIIVAVAVSLFQELITTNNKPVPPPPTVTTQAGEQMPLQMTGPKIQGIRIQSTDKFHGPLKQILARNQLNIEITSYEFQGNEYWLNMILNWGHIVLIYILIGKYKTQTNQSTKRKIMIGGAIAVIAWFYLSSTMKPQRVAIEVNGAKLYDREYLDDKEVIDILNEYEFEIQDLKEATQKETFTENAHQANPESDAPEQDSNPSSSSNQPRTEQTYTDEQIF